VWHETHQEPTFQCHMLLTDLTLRNARKHFVAECNCCQAPNFHFVKSDVDFEWHSVVQDLYLRYKRAARLATRVPYGKIRLIRVGTSCGVDFEMGLLSWA
jgi:hypothetical protein